MFRLPLILPDGRLFVDRSMTLFFEFITLSLVACHAGDNLLSGFWFMDLGSPWTVKCLGFSFCHTLVLQDAVGMRSWRKAVTRTMGVVQEEQCQFAPVKH